MSSAAPPPGKPQAAARPASAAAARAPASGSPAIPTATATTTNAAPGAQLAQPAVRSDQPLIIEPTATGNNDPSVSVEWRPVQLGAQSSVGCSVRGPPGHSVSVVIEQGAYRKKLFGTESIEITAIPAAAAGTAGTLTASGEDGAVLAQYVWAWQPKGAAKRAPVAKQPQADQQKRAAAGQQAKTTPAAQSQSAGGNVSTTFFGQPAQGQRFAFILDKSGSMAGRRWATCLRELSAALLALSGQGEFFVVLFSDRLEEPPGQLDWTLANPDVINAVIEWMGHVEPNGATMPAPAFERVFALSARPDALYFMTDGEFSDCTPSDVARLNGSGTASRLGAFALGIGRTLFGKGSEPPATVINTIALDDSRGADVLRKIAAQSGGQYVHRSSE